LSRRGPAFLLFLALFNSVLGFSILFPIFGPLGRQLGMSEIQIGTLSAAYSLAQLISSPGWGRRSERVGRRPVLLIGIWGFCLGFAAFGFIAWLGLRGTITGMPLFAVLLLSRGATGSLSAAVMPSAQAYMADITPRERRTSGMAVIGAAFGLGVILGPGIGAALSTFGLLVPMFFASAVAMLNGLFVMTSLPEPERHTARSEPSLSHSFGLAWPWLTVALGLTLATVALEQTAAFLYQDVLHLTHKQAARTVGIALVLYGLGAVLSQGVLMRRKVQSPHKWLLVGILLNAVGLAGTAVAGQFWSLTASLVIQGFASGMAMPALTAILSLSVGDDRQGEVAGLNSGAQALGRTLGPIAGTTLYMFNCRSPFWAGAGLAAAFGLALIVPAIRGAKPEHSMG